MSQTDREKWDTRYREGSYGTRTHPSELLVEWLPQLTKGRALDVACGVGRNALYLSTSGYDVDAIDISSIALECLRKAARTRGLELTCLEIDLESDPLPTKHYDLILLVRYTNSALITRLLPLLADGGHFVCEEHLETDEEVIGPTDPAFRVAPDELLQLTSELDVLFYNEGIVQDPDGRRAALARLVARKSVPGS
jgi:SAM-dependent methyltransferase